MVYESDFYTTRRSYSRPSYSTYSVTYEPAHLYPGYGKGQTYHHSIPHAGHMRLTAVSAPTFSTRTRPSVIMAEIDRINHRLRPSLAYQPAEDFLNSRSIVVAPLFPEGRHYRPIYRVATRFADDHRYWPTYRVTTLFGDSHHYWPTYRVATLFPDNRKYWPTYRVTTLFADDYKYWPTYRVTTLFADDHKYWPTYRVAKLLADNRKYWPTYRVTSLFPAGHHYWPTYRMAPLFADSRHYWPSYLLSRCRKDSFRLLQSFDDEARAIRGQAAHLLKRIHTPVPRALRPLPVITTGYEYEELPLPPRITSDMYIQRLLGLRDVQHEVLSRSYYNEPGSRANIGKGHLACVQYAGGKAFSRRRPLASHENNGDYIRNNVKMLSHYERMREAAKSPVVEEKGPEAEQVASA